MTFGDALFNFFHHILISVFAITSCHLIAFVVMSLCGRLWAGAIPQPCPLLFWYSICWGITHFSATLRHLFPCPFVDVRKFPRFPPTPKLMWMTPRVLLLCFGFFLFIFNVSVVAFVQFNFSHKLQSHLFFYYLFRRFYSMLTFCVYWFTAMRCRASYFRLCLRK